MEDGDLLLVDAGCELDYYASDVTRTFPVGGAFSDDQQALYDAVLEAQSRRSRRCDPARRSTPSTPRSSAASRRRWCASGSSRARPSASSRRASDGSAGIQSPDEPLARHGCARRRRLLPWRPAAPARGQHGAHDRAGDLRAPRRRARAPAFRGLGVRIEDDVLVTAAGHRVLTHDIPKTIADVERACRG